jgi:hypothetical protein
MIAIEKQCDSSFLPVAIVPSFSLSLFGRLFKVLCSCAELQIAPGCCVYFSCRRRIRRFGEAPSKYISLMEHRFESNAEKNCAPLCKFQALLLKEQLEAIKLMRVRAECFFTDSLPKCGCLSLLRFMVEIF